MVGMHTYTFGFRKYTRFREGFDMNTACRLLGDKKGRFLSKCYVPDYDWEFFILIHTVLSSVSRWATAAEIRTASAYP